MKRIKAYVQRDRIADVIAAIKQHPTWAGASGAERHSLAVCVAMGSLMPFDDLDRRYEVVLGDEFVDAFRIEVLCPDDEVESFVVCVADAARTGRPGSGWITVSELARALPIR